MSNTLPNSLDATNNSLYVKANETIVDLITDNTITINTSGLTGLLDPVNLFDGVNKKYTDTYIGLHPGSSISGPISSIQYNASGIFGGSSNLTWTSTTKILSVASLSDGTMTWTGTSITGLVNPTTSTDISNKEYINSFNNITRTTISLNQNAEYTAAQVINGIITRTGFNDTLIDLLPTAASLIAALQSVKSSTLTVKNETIYDNSIVLIVPNIGINIYSVRKNSTSSIYEKQLYVLLYKNYQVNFKFIVESNGSISFLIENLSLMTSINDASTTSQFISNQFDITSSSNSFKNVLHVTENFMSRFDPTIIITDSNIVYSVDTILNKYIIRGPGLTANRTDSLVPAGNLTSIVPYPFQPTNNSINENTGLTFYVRNQDPTYNVTVNLSSSGYTADFLTSISTITPGKTGIFGISFSRTASVNTVWIYVIGIV